MMTTYYHITTEDLGNRCFLEPRIPSVCDSSKENNNIPRICVSRSPTNCFLAIHQEKIPIEWKSSCDSAEHIYVIEIDENHKNFHIPSKEELFDADSYEERWILSPIEAIRVVCTSFNTIVEEINRGTFDTNVTTNPSSLVRNVKQLKPRI